METLINRFRRKSAENKTAPKRTDATTTVAADTSVTRDPDKINTTLRDSEKPNEQVTSSSPSPLSEEEAEEVEDLPDDVRELPKIVRNIVSLEDDPSAPTITFRYFLLCFIFVPPGAILFQMGIYRTTSAVYPVLFVQIASHYVGQWLADALPKKTVQIPFTRFGFSLNPGPWSAKENVLVTVTAASGATSNAAWSSISLAQLYYDTYIPAAASIFLMWAIVYLGYAMAALARQFLLYDPIYTWPYALMQTAVFETLIKSVADSWLAKKQKFVFFGTFAFIIFWQFLPEYVFPMLSSLSFLCWVAPRNPVANFIGAGIGGMGFLNLSLDWANISNQTFISPMIVPFWTTVVLTAAFVFNCWWNLNLMSNRIFLENGTKYPADALITPDLGFNETAYRELGLVYMGTQAIWALFFDYASYISALTWMGLFGYSQIRDTLEKLRTRAQHKGTDTVNDFYTDRLNVLMRSYPEIPLWWYIALFTFFVAIATSGVMILPFSWLYSFSSFQVAIGSFNELLYGFMVNAVSGHKHPAGATAYGSIAGDIWYRAQYMLQDQKIRHYMHVPPRAIFFSQIFGELIGVPINYGVIQWVLKSKGDYILGNKKDPLNQWTGQSLASYNTMGVQYVLIGPKPPLVLFALHRTFPKSKLKFHLWNITIFSASVAQFYGNLSTGYISRLLVGYICMQYYYRRRFETWKRYNYLIAAALDAGFNVAMLLMFIFFSSGKQVFMPNWWGNDETSVERCFALEE
ncbi:putative oligopeptide transporter [Lentithecium fluviatile CBS 122367]|uniref:Putative oligopeptide transporter n=1 Tax=Lentithecium fluviatile CBS 122367 TaxID=1168545 RepID=A0A6G1J299_9PLEO|nr:putative oligopeptide transporter [Lentithecium fluviatile CBS 122367]